MVGKQKMGIPAPEALEAVPKGRKTYGGHALIAQFRATGSEGGLDSLGRSAGLGPR